MKAEHVQGCLRAVEIVLSLFFHKLPSEERKVVLALLEDDLDPVLQRTHGTQFMEGYREYLDILKSLHRCADED